MAAAPTDVWRRARDIDFTVQKEPWGTCEVDRDVVIRSRAVLLKLQKIPGEPGQPTGILPNVAPLLAVDAPSKVRKVPTDPQPTNEQVAAAEKIEVEFRSLEEPWSVYEFDDGGPKLIRVKLVVAGVSRVADMYDMFGVPIYQVNHTTVVAPPVPRKAYSGR